MRNKITAILNEIADLLELKGENPFKARAYSSAARKISDEKIDIEQAVKDGTIGDIDGIGKALKEKLTELVETGRMEYYENLKKEVPEELIELSRLKGLGPKKAKNLFENHNISSLKELQKMAESGKLKSLRGFGAKSEQFIVDAIKEKKTYEGKFRMDSAYKDAKSIMDSLKELPGVEKISITGELYRCMEVVNDIRFVIQINDKQQTLEKISKQFDISEKDGHWQLTSPKGIPVYLYFAEKENFGLLVHKYAGSEEYLDTFNEFISNGYKIKEDKLYSKDHLVEVNSERELYKRSGLQYVPPEVRENPQTVQFANTGEIPELVHEEDMQGMLHCHSTWSDGLHSIEQMALGAKELGYKYFAICDHSRSAGYANGLSNERVKKQHEEIDELNEKDLGIKILKGIESDILKDGSLDYEEDILEKFDVVVASVHSIFNMDEKEMTDRIIRALMSPYTTILGHPTGRLLLRRKSYPLDQKAVIDAAAEYKKVIEINANPRRLDLDWRMVSYAKQKGVKLAVNPDAHNVNGLKHVSYGIKMARKGWLEKNDVVNTYPFEKFKMEIMSR